MNANPRETRFNDLLAGSKTVRVPLSKISLRVVVVVVPVGISMSRDCRRRSRSLLTTRLNLESVVPVGRAVPTSSRINLREES